jgi:SCP-2 sterol transfer family
VIAGSAKGVVFAALESPGEAAACGHDRSRWAGRRPGVLDFRGWPGARSVMRGRLRGVGLWQIFRTIRQRAQPGTRLDAIVEFRVTGRRDGGIDRYQLALIDGRGRRPRRDAPRPALTLELEPVAFLWLVGGTASTERLLIAGKLKLRGDLLLALALPTALRVPRRRPRTLRKR